MKGFSRKFPGFALLAAGAAVAGALGIGLPLALPGAPPVDVVDVSASVSPPVPLPPDARTFADSRLGSALRAAAATGASRIRLFTDACDPTGAVPAPVGVPVDVVLRPRRDDVGVLAVRTPARIPAATDFAVEIVVGRTDGGAGETEALVRLARDGERVGAPVRVRLRPGATRRVRIRDRVDRPGTVVYRASVQGIGAPANDVREAVARIGDEPAVLAVGAALPAGFAGRAVSPAAVASALRGARAEGFDALLLAGPLPDREAQARVAAAVRDGLGLVVLEGRAFAGKPLGDVLPLTDTPPGGRAVLLLLDFSGSMQPRKEELLAAVDALRDGFAPDDRVAYVAFRDRPVGEADWSAAADADWDLRAIQPRGNTALGPALVRARALLRDVRGARRRLFVVSDGEWSDRGDSALAERLRAFADDQVHTGLLLVRDAMAEGLVHLFPLARLAGEDLAADLRRLDEAAPDRTVAGPVDAVAGRAPDWLTDALPPPGPYRALARLWPRERGEAIPLRAGELPVAGAWRRGGKVVQLAPRVDANPAVAAALSGLLRAVLRERGGERLRAWREGGAVMVEAAADVDAARVAGVAVALRPVAPDRRRARIENASRASLRVEAGGAAVVVPAAAADELAGLTSRPDLAAAIARASGGRLYRDRAPEDEPRTAPAVSLTLLAGAALVLASALRRRHS